MDKLRRRLLQTGAAGILGGTAFSRILACKPVQAAKPAKIPDFTVEAFEPQHSLTIARGKDHYAVTQKAIETFGGMSSFVKKGDVVLVKPNAAWNRPPIFASNTSPDVLRAVIDAVRAQGAKRVIVADNTCNEAKKAYRRSGIEEACKKSGADLLILDESDYMPVTGSGTFLDGWPFMKLFQQVNKVINVPVVKSHGMALTTVSMKNWFGAIGGKRSKLHEDIDKTIVALGKSVTPTLVVADATRILMRNGPNGGTVDDVKTFDEVVVGTDQVLVDTYGSVLMGHEKKLPRYLKMAEKAGVGTSNLKDAKKSEVNVPA